MCGICGVVETTRPPDLTLVTAMMARLTHRGPDGSGCYRDRRAALGHTRLAIIDQAGGAQPLANEDETVWVTFNGEIYNYVELSAQLRARGHVFRTSSDTEAIVHAWEEWGAGCFSRFNGQWAVAIWDARDRRLVLSRDRLGVRPLFYTRDGGHFLFASEIKALFADATVRREFDPVGFEQIFTFWSTVAPRTPFRGVEQLPPGHFAVLDGVDLEVRPYWRIGFPERGQEAGQDLEENAQVVREAVVAATRLRFLRSDVPVGAYLSGGIDSAVTASAIRRVTGAPLRTFSLRFADREFDEGPFQALVAERLGTEHGGVDVTGPDIAENFPNVVWHTETPILRAAPAPLFQLSQLVRDSGFKVVVTGEGADEVLAGYDIFREARVRLFYARNPSALRARALELLYPWMVRSPGQAPAFARGFFGRNLDPADPAVSHRPRWDATSALRALFTPEWASATEGVDVAEELVQSMPAESSCWDPLSRAQWLEMTTLLPGYILASQGDRMLMAHSVEGRFPFLDPDLVQVAAALPARHKLLGLEEKYVLKRAFADWVPPEVVNRPKQPYRAPDASPFLRPDAPAWVAEALAECSVRRAGVFDLDKVARLVAKGRRCEGVGMSNSDTMRIAAVVSTQLAHQHFVAGDGSRPGGVTHLPLGPMTVHDRIEPEGDEWWLTRSSERRTCASTPRRRSPGSRRRSSST